MKGIVITISLLLLTGVLKAQADSVELKGVIQKLDNALIKQDSAVLELLLDKKLSYGHSNGWIQNKEDMWADFKSGRITYKKIESSNTSYSNSGKEWMMVRTNSLISGNANGKDFELNLHVLQVWKKEKKGWQLVARQSTKI